MDGDGKRSCAVCEKPIEDAGSAFQRAVGWLRAVDGKNFRTERRMDEWAHPWCVEKAQTVGAAQESLL